jgi:hypothetical protein
MPNPVQNVFWFVQKHHRQVPSRFAMFGMNLLQAKLHKTLS